MAHPFSDNKLAAAPLRLTQMAFLFKLNAPDRLNFDEVKQAKQSYNQLKKKIAVLSSVVRNGKLIVATLPCRPKYLSQFIGMLSAGIQNDFEGLYLWIPDPVRYDKRMLVILTPGYRIGPAPECFYPGSGMTIRNKPF